MQDGSGVAIPSVFHPPWIRHMVCIVSESLSDAGTLLVYIVSESLSDAGTLLVYIVSESLSDAGTYCWSIT